MNVQFILRCCINSKFSNFALIFNWIYLLLLIFNNIHIYIYIYIFNVHYRYFLGSMSLFLFIFDTKPFWIISCEYTVTFVILLKGKNLLFFHSCKTCVHSHIYHIHLFFVYNSVFHAIHIVRLQTMFFWDWLANGLML